MVCLGVCASIFAAIQRDLSRIYVLHDDVSWVGQAFRPRPAPTPGSWGRSSLQRDDHRGRKPYENEGANAVRRGRRHRPAVKPLCEFLLIALRRDLNSPNAKQSRFSGCCHQSNDRVCGRFESSSAPRRATTSHAKSVPSTSDILRALGGPGFDLFEGSKIPRRPRSYARTTLIAQHVHRRKLIDEAVTLRDT